MAQRLRCGFGDIRDRVEPRRGRDQDGVVRDTGDPHAGALQDRNAHSAIQAETGPSEREALRSAARHDRERENIDSAAMSPKSLTGEDLVLDDGPARDAQLFLVDGNNLAYRAYFALPEELQTTDGQPTNALLGFANMLFKLLSDYHPRGVAVAWDTRPVHRAAAAEAVDVIYKEGRRPMPDLLREQFPYFRPIVEAFGYRNLEFEGWEADDVIATLATAADAAAIKTCVVSTDRDAFQLCSDNVVLMMTPRGVSDVNVYTADRVFDRYGIRPHQIPDFIGLKGDSSDNIPGVPGIGDKTAGQLIAQYGTLESVIEHAADLSPTRSRNIIEHADQARASRDLATMRRDLELDCDPVDLVLAPPDRSTLKEMFRRFEFRGLLGRVDTLDEALPAAERPVATGASFAWRHGEVGRPSGRVAVAADGERIAVATAEGVVVGEAGPLSEQLAQAAVEAHDAKALRLRFPAAEDTLLAAYLVDPGRAGYDLDDLAAEQGIELEPDPPADDDIARLVRHAEIVRRLAPILREKVRERGSEQLYDEIELPLTAVLSAMEDAGVKIDTYRMGEITARLADRVEELEAKAVELAGEPFLLGSTQQVARILFEVLGLATGRKGKTGYSTDARVLRGIRDAHPIVGVVEEWRELTKLLNTYLLPLPALIDERDGRLHTTFNQAVAATGRLSTTNPNLQSIPVRTELGREIRSAFIAEDGHRLLSADYSQVELRILAHVSGEPVLREAFARGEDIHAATAAEVLGKDRATLTRAERNVAKMVNFGIIYGISAFGLSENLEIPREEAQAYIDMYLARFPQVQAFIERTVAQARADGYVTTLLGRRRPIPELRASNWQTRSLGERLAVNTVMQGTAADVIKVAMVRAQARLQAEGRSARLVLQVHDELLLEVPETEVSAVRELVRSEMIGAYPLDPPLAVDVGVGDNWASAKD
jgi:DNA polymerase I